MARYGGDQIEFAILGLVQNPLEQSRDRLAQNISSLRTLRARRPNSSEVRTWERDGHPDTLLGPDPRYGIDQEMLDRIDQQQGGSPNLRADEGTETLEGTFQELTHAQKALRISVAEAQEADQEDEQKSEGRRFEYGPVLHAWVLFHARRGVIHQILAAIQG